MTNLFFLWGQGTDLTALQMAVRSTVAFIITLILIRIGGVRIFGRRSAYDTIIIIMMGSLLAKGIAGSSPFWSTIAGAAMMIFIHRVMGWMSSNSRAIESLIKGKQNVLYHNGEIIHKNLLKAALTETDLLESLRLETKQDSLEKVEQAFIETNGRISFILKKSKDD